MSGADCTCYPCVTPAYGVPGIAHCAACCYGTQIEEYDHLCPRSDHREIAVRQFGALTILDNDGRGTVSFQVAATREMPDMTDHEHRFDGTMRCMGCGKHHDDLPEEETWGYDPTTSDMAVRYRLYHNLDARFFRPGEVEDRYLDGHQGETRVTRDWNPSQVAEHIFMIHNRDDRPDGQRRPSLSVGDVMELDLEMAHGPMSLNFTVDRIGMEPVGWKPEQVHDDYPEGYFEETRR